MATGLSVGLARRLCGAGPCVFMALTELRYLLAVARERHFGRAAEACHVAQPTLSVAIKKLEEELDVKILSAAAVRWG